MKQFKRVAILAFLVAAAMLALTVLSSASAVWGS